MDSSQVLVIFFELFFDQFIFIPYLKIYRKFWQAVS